MIHSRIWIFYLSKCEPSAHALQLTLYTGEGIKKKSPTNGIKMNGMRYNAISNDTA